MSGMPALIGRSLLAGLIGLSILVSRAVAQDPFAENVRSTAPLSPDEQWQSFQLPDDLRIDLIAAEPTIQKPLNLAFDARGRLWLTCTIEYPYPAAEGQGRDRIVILEDTNGDGSYDHHTIFADDLNIPIGILPLDNECIVFDIPYIWKLSDTNGDGRCDQKLRLLGPFDCSRDTHGMNNSFIAGFDGWIYACHGFANRSQVAGADGHQVTLNSGNVYRFRPDGSRIEHFSHGQVNPYGMACDDWFALFTADCHSKPLTQVLRGAYYPSFGAPHDGLGFAPSMMEHFHGSTAIAGVEVLAGASWPQAYQGQIVSGNVMTSRVNRNELRWDGAYAQAMELPDLLATSDPWFRPVHLIQGPSGGLYVADFYNRIIGHYEVPLEHPGRDRDRGRIWRIRAADSSSQTVGRWPGDGSATAQLQALWNLLKHDHVRTRMAAINALVARGQSRPQEAEWIITQAEQAFHGTEQPHLQVAALWCLVRLAPERLDAPLLNHLRDHPAPVVRGHLQRVLAEAWPLGTRDFKPGQTADATAGAPRLPPGRGPLLPVTREDFLHLLTAGLTDTEPRVVQLASDAAGRFPATELLPHLVALAAATDRDPAIVHTARIALKHALSADGPMVAGDAASAAASLRERWQWLSQDSGAKQQAGVLAGVMLAIPTAQAADYLLDYLKTPGAIDGRAAEMIQQAAKYLPAARAPELVHLIQTQFADAPRSQWELLNSIAEGLARSGQPTPASVRAWALQLSLSGLHDVKAQAPGWESLTADRRRPAQAQDDAWRIETRPVRQQDSALTDAEPQTWVPMVSSLPAGEQRTGILRSPRFTLPESLEFLMAGHRGFPDQTPHERNQVRLVLNDGTVAHVAYPPRHDDAQRVRWDLRAWAGQSGWLEIQDGDSAGAYAWLAVGQFEPPVIEVPRWSPSELTAALQALCRVATRFRLSELVPDLHSLLRARAVPPGDQWLIAQTVAELQGHGFARNLAAELARENLPSDTEAALIWLAGFWDPASLADPPATPQSETLMFETGEGQRLLTWVPSLSSRQQQVLVRAAMNEPEVFDTLLGWAETGRLAAESFRDPVLQQPATVTARPDWKPRIEHLLRDLPSTDGAWIARARQAEQRFKPWLEQLQNSGRLSAEQIPLESELEQQAITQGDLGEWKRLGQQVFTRDCAACHQLGGQGGLVGPQLDGIDRRGLERVLEDVLLPNQNVDHAFRAQLLLLESGQVVVGLIQAEDEVSLQLTDQQGKPMTVPVAQIDQRQTTTQSLMPGDVAHQYNDATLFALMCYLLDQDRRPDLHSP